jgi:hypothetical protein
MSDGESQSSSPSSTSKVTQGKGRERAADQQEPIKKVSVRDVTQTPKKPEARTGQPGPERKALPPAQSSGRRKKAAATAAAAAQGSTSSGVRVAGPGGVSPLATTKKAAETYSKPASGAPKRPARKTKVTAAKPAAAAKPKREPNPKKPGKPSLDDLLKSEEYQLTEKAESKQQQKLFGLALSVKRGETSRSEVSAEVLKIVDDMSEKEIRKFAKTSHEGLPKKVQTKEEAIREALLDRMLGKIKQLDEFSLPGTGMVMAPKTNKATGVTAPMMQRKVLGMNVGSPEMVKTSKPSEFGPIRQYTPQQVDRYNAQPNRPSTIKPDSLTGVQSSVAKPSAKPAAPKPTPSVTPKPTPPETASAGMARGLKGVPFLGDVADIANRADRKINYRDAPPELRKQMGLKNSYEPEGEMVDEAEHRIKKPTQYAKPRGTYDPTGIGMYPRTPKERKKMSRGEKVVPYKSLNRESD